MTKKEYLRCVKLYSLFIALYTSLGLIACFFIISALIKVDNSPKVITIVFGIFTFISLCLFTLTMHIGKYKFNFVDEKLHNKVNFKIRNAFALLYLNFWYNAMIFFGFLYFGVLNIVDMGTATMAIILMSTLLGFAILSFYLIGRSFRY